MRKRDYRHVGIARANLHDDMQAFVNRPVVAEDQFDVVACAQQLDRPAEAVVEYRDRGFLVKHWADEVMRLGAEGFARWSLDVPLLPRSGISSSS